MMIRATITPETCDPRVTTAKLQDGTSIAWIHDDTFSWSLDVPGEGPQRIAWCRRLAKELTAAADTMEEANTIPTDTQPPTNDFQDNL